MKKIFLMAAIFAVTVAHSQKLYHAYRLEAGRHANKGYETTETRKINMDIVVQNGTVLMGDQAQSTYRISKEIWSTKEAGKGWDAIDEKDRKCIVGVVTNVSGTVIFSVYYGDFFLAYYLDTPKSKLDNLLSE